MRQTTTSIRRGAAGVLLLGTLALSGCISFGPKAPETLFRLTPERSAPVGTAISGSETEALVILEPETDRRLGVQRVPVQIDDANVAYLKDAAWVERPSRLFRDLLAETLRSKGRLVFTGAELDADGRQRLTGRLMDMGYDSQRRVVVVRFDAVRNGGGRSVSTRRFEATEPVAEANPQLIGPALNRTANVVAGQVAEWIG